MKKKMVRSTRAVPLTFHGGAAPYPKKRLLQAGALAAALAGCSATPPVEVPAAIKAPIGQTLGIVTNAEGVQIYECRSENGRQAWVFVAPEATLFGTHGAQIGTHGLAANGAGPYWEATDGSRVVGAVKGRAEAPQGGAVAWLLLSAKAEGQQGMLSTVKSIQRINTVGGLAPAAGCAPENHGQRLRVPYTATYRFFVERLHSSQLYS
jgi:hypothetical protein